MAELPATGDQLPGSATFTFFFHKNYAFLGMFHSNCCFKGICS